MREALTIGAMLALGLLFLWAGIAKDQSRNREYLAACADTGRPVAECRLRLMDIKRGADPTERALGESR